MKPFASLAAAAMLLCVGACAAEDSAQTATTAPQSPAKAAQESAPRPEAMTREEARAAAEAKDKLRAVDPREELQKVAQTEDSETEAPTAPAASSSFGDAALIARGDQAFVAGRDYIVLTPAQRTSSPPEKVEITEVFMYQCPHCFSFEPFIENLIKDQPPEVNFVRMPAIFNPIAELHAKAYYASRALGVWEELHTPFFREIHTNRNLMRTEDQLLDFIEKQGIERGEFANLMRSFEVDSKVRDAKDLNRRYRIDSVPTMVINGKYVTSASLVKSTAKLREIIDYLVNKEGAEL